MKTVIIHGHFYQPPRENPWSGIIEDQQSAAPYDNWNQRILEECYEANGWSPVLNPKGETSCILNNYEYLSFNFGPTLLSWIRENAPSTYMKIKEGDRKSLQKNGGHGNALAQVYNHMILPLASEKDRLTQIEWGIRDFQFHFERDPEGMWLAETAIHPETADELVRAGIRFTVLSPWQAAYYTMDSEKTVKAGNSPLLWQRPWILPCPSGDLTIFFYHPGLSSDISFQHLLGDANQFYNRVDSELNLSESGQLPIATDGEIYGHHERLGNMGLAAFLSKIQNSQDKRMSNFAAQMDGVEPAGTVVLQSGEEDKGSSWSCFHGVSRWYKDCGCSTGGKEGWNQKWRTPLREGLNRLSEETDRIFQKGMGRLTGKDPWEIRNKYIEVLLNPSKGDDFYTHYGSGKKSSSDKNLFFRLLEGQKYKMFMFTSCGWFFSDISGIEPLQNLMYAARSIDLYSPFFSISPEPALLESLADAESNDPSMGNGAVLYTSRKFDREKQKFKMAASLILSRFYSLDCDRESLGFYKVLSYTAETTDENIYTGEIVLQNIYTQSYEPFRFEIQAEKKLFSRMTLISRQKSVLLYPEDLSLPVKKSLMKALSIFRNTSSRSISNRFCDMLSQLNEMMHLGIPGNHHLNESVDALLYYTLREITYLMEQGISDAWISFEKIIQTASKWGIALPGDLTVWLRTILDRGIEEWRIKNSHNRDEWEKAYKELKILLTTTGSIPGKPITHTQKGMIYDVLFGSEEGRRLLSFHKEEIRNDLLKILNFAPDFHLPEVSEKDRS